VATLALAVASVGLFAVPRLMDGTMRAQVRADRLPDLTFSIRPLRLDRTQLAALGALPNVREVEPRAFFGGTVQVGSLGYVADVIGIPDFARQRVNVVHLASGTAPGSGEVLTDVQNANHGFAKLQAGETIQVLDSHGGLHDVRVSGEGRNLEGGQTVASNGVFVLYATAATVESLRGVPGYEALAFRLADTRPSAISATTAAVGRALARIPGFRGFTALPQVRSAGDWPGRSGFQKFTKFFDVVTVLALFSALVLIANTIATLVAEQTSDIGIMKAVGGRRRQIASVYLRTVLLLGALGTVAGLVLGTVLANVLTRYFARSFYQTSAAVGIDFRVTLACVVVGLLGPVLAALPAIRRAVRVPVRDALEATGSAVGAQDAGDRTLRRVRFLPRTAQIGLRGAGRRRRRSLSTVVVIALAVGNLLAIVGLATSITDTTHASWGDHGEDATISALGQRPFDAQAARLIRATSGVASIEPMFVTGITLAGKDGDIWAVRPRTMFHYRLVQGRWYTPAEARARARVAVVERDIARVTGTRLGDRIRVKTAAGPLTLRVIGISSNQQENGTALFVPLTTMHAILTGMPADANDYWVRTTLHDHAFIDTTTSSIDAVLTSDGYDVGTEIVYISEANEVASNRTLTTSVAVLGFLIVAISMAGLANTLAMSVLERTREIGILRSIGARARDVRRIFAAETVALAVAGWAIGVPLGYLLEAFLVWLVRRIVNVDTPVVYPASNVALALVGTIFLALLVTLPPIRRAVRFRPGDALRYA
jgi:putative ABC transport system permease protein